VRFGKPISLGWKLARSQNCDCFGYVKYTQALLICSGYKTGIQQSNVLTRLGQTPIIVIEQIEVELVITAVNWNSANLGVRAKLGTQGSWSMGRF